MSACIFERERDEFIDSSNGTCRFRHLFPDLISRSPREHYGRASYKENRSVSEKSAKRAR